MKQLLIPILLLALIQSPVRAEDAPSIPNDRLNNPEIAVYRRSPTELWIYDTRPETGVGAHQLDDETIKQIRTANIRLVRITMYWGIIENTTTPGQYDPKALTHWDDLIKRCDQAGIVPLILVHSNPPGVNFAQREASYKRFAHFMADMVKRYPTVRFWELWNEMDQAFTDLFGAKEPAISLRERGKLYAQMLKLAYPAIKAANPKAWVLTGGMTDWNEFPRGIYEGGGRDYFDFMNLHTYGVPVLYGFVGRGLSLYSVMRDFHDEARPIWNTEFGIDAGNVVNAWGLPHTRKSAKEDGSDFDAVHLKTWRDCIEDNAKRHLYVKTLGYQFKAGNETAKEKMKEAKLPTGQTPDDYGLGLFRNDGQTPRPTYNWLKTDNPNAAIIKTPERTIDIEAYIPDGATPIGHQFDYQWRKPWMIIKGVKVNSLEPTIIQLKPQAP